MPVNLNRESHPTRILIILSTDLNASAMPPDLNISTRYRPSARWRNTSREVGHPPGKRYRSGPPRRPER